MYDIQKIMKCLPHRYPFLLVDRVLEIDEQHAVGIKNVTINEPFFQGHFPSEPVMPGVLVLEAMGQVAAMMMSARPGSENLITVLQQADELLDLDLHGADDADRPRHAWSSSGIVG